MSWLQCSASVLPCSYCECEMYLLMATLGIQFDDMDNSKSMLPRMVEKTKSMVGLKKLKTKILGCILNSLLYDTGRCVKFYLSHDQFENGSNKRCSPIFLRLG